MIEIWNTIIFPFLLGLLGFIEPCSLGANFIFLQYILFSSPEVRLFHSLLFTITRALFLSVLGLMAAFAGQKIIGAQGYYILFLGLIYIILGLIILIRGQGWGFSLPFPRLSEKSLPFLLGGVFGLAIPACASPLILALMGGAALSGQLWFGFSSLLLFGLGLSLPLVLVVYSRKAPDWMTYIASKYPRRLQYLLGCLLLFAGLYTLLTQNGSLGIILQR